MEQLKISKEVNELMEHLSKRDMTISEKIAVTRSAGDMLQQIVTAEALMVNMANFLNREQ